MPIGNLIVLGAIVAAFLIFMLVLGSVAWWSGQTSNPRRVRANAAASSARSSSEAFAGFRAH